MAYLSKGPRTVAMIMAPITAAQEKTLDESGTIVLEMSDNIFQLTRREVHYYGEIDFTPGSDDIQILEDSRMFYNMDPHGVDVPANYDYENHCCYSDSNKAKWFDTVNAALICKYAHGILGKPKRMAIFEV